MVLYSHILINVILSNALCVAVVAYKTTAVNGHFISDNCSKKTCTDI